eukprot:COSAG01_NODE_6220_length_3784_cov_1.767707_1_plen_100_part_00
MAPVLTITAPWRLAVDTATELATTVSADEIKPMVSHWQSVNRTVVVAAAAAEQRSFVPLYCFLTGPPTPDFLFPRAVRNFRRERRRGCYAQQQPLLHCS